MGTTAEAKAKPFSYQKRQFHVWNEVIRTARLRDRSKSRQIVERETERVIRSRINIPLFEMCPRRCQGNNRHTILRLLMHM